MTEIPRLSLMQKSILKHAFEEGNGRIVHLNEINHKVARDLHTKDSPKILDPNAKEDEIMAGYEKQMNTKKNQEGIQGLETEASVAGKLMEIIKMAHPNGSFLTASFRASFSRSLKRLERRGFVKRISSISQDADGRIILEEEGRTNYLIITEVGMKIAEPLSESHYPVKAGEEERRV